MRDDDLDTGGGDNRCQFFGDADLAGVVVLRDVQISIAHIRIVTYGRY